MKLCSTDQKQVPQSKHFNSGKTTSCMEKDLINEEHVQVVFVFKLTNGNPKLICILLDCPTENQTIPLQIQFFFRYLL
jgi:hypothetical protein